MLSITSFGKRMVLLVVGGMEGILKLDTQSPRNTNVLHTVYDKYIAMYALQTTCVRTILFSEVIDLFCENCFCIYWVTGRCSLDEVALDIQGTCRQCIYVDLEEEVLKQYREKFLERYNQEL